MEVEVTGSNEKSFIVTYSMRDTQITSTPPRRFRGTDSETVRGGHGHDHRDPVTIPSVWSGCRAPCWPAGARSGTIAERACSAVSFATLRAAPFRLPAATFTTAPLSRSFEIAR